jgi:lipoprotein NlpD
MTGERNAKRRDFHRRVSRYHLSRRIFQVAVSGNRRQSRLSHRKQSLRRNFFAEFCHCPFQLPALLLIIILLLGGCGNHIYHFVEPGETLYSISWAYGYDYREVAKWNDIRSPYIIKKGQRLRVTPPPSHVAVIDKSIQNNKLKTNHKAPANKVSQPGADKKPVTKPVTRNHRINASDTASPAAIKWQWPTRGGRLVQTFKPRIPGKQGLDVAGNMGQAVYSAAAGEVVYSGGGLNRYGKLIIVKHNETYLSAYAHNKRLLVKEGERLKAGQLIAEMGSTGTNTTKLHFEIRQNGKPVDPLQYLPKKMQ